MASAAIKRTSHQGEQLKSFTLELHSNRVAARKYNVEEKRIREWKKKHAGLSHARVRKGYWKKAYR